MKTESTQAQTDVARARLGRRALLGAGAVGISGAAITLLPLITSRAGASSGTDDATTVPTTAPPPRRPTNSDIGYLGAVQQFELTGRALYDAAIAAGAWSDTEATVMTTIRETHEAAAHALAGLLGVDAPNDVSSTLFNSLVAGFKGSVADRLTAAYDFESALVAGHSAALANLEGIDGATLLAAIQSAEARHGTVLADLAGRTDISTLLVLEEAEPLDVTA